MNNKLYTSNFSDSFWSDSNLKSFVSTSVSHKKQIKQNTMEEVLSSIDAMPEFHDPYSDVSLFLSEKIKEEIKHCQTEKKWSLKLQEELINKITPEFQKKFPHYRLGVMALKKTWEKVIYYSHQIEGQSQATLSDGSLNIEFFIKENLRQYSHLRQKQSPVAYHYADQLASKISEFSASIDGVKPEWESLTRNIWAMQRHLLIGRRTEVVKSPYDTVDKADRLIAKTALEITAKEPLIEQKELQLKILESLKSIQELSTFSSLDTISCIISSLIAEKLYPCSQIHLQFSLQQKLAITSFIKRHSSLYKMNTTSPQLSELVRRIIALYTLATQMPKEISEEDFALAIDCCYPEVKNDRPPFEQALYAFISAELLLMRDCLSCKSIEFVKKAVFQSYKETMDLPIIDPKESNVLSIAIWKILSESEGFLEKIPYKIGKRIDEEIGQILIDHPDLSFDGVVTETVRFFQMAKESSEKHKSKELEHKAYLASLQSDMISSTLDIDFDLPLVKLIKAKFSEEFTEDPTDFVNSICQQYLKQYRTLTIYAAQVSTKAWIYFKVLWYTHFTSSEESSFDRFLSWHKAVIYCRSPQKERELMEKLSDICQKCLPLAPFDKAYFEESFFSKEKKYAY